ncbi:hypothetical protein GR198_29265 [Rhizobium leguminosarum]|uniref:hypothetical protein n=1 Tax=Rhizobium leguminosarum TaxID=384 RepID=UPI0013C07C48|nr:hypothetical protein [Rhizobium leguminosarum]NEH59817.1 hypothetical protein [Rhizobium leguminosarum]
MSILDQYPEIDNFIDKTDSYSLSTNEINSGGRKYLIVTQVGEVDSGQLLFEMTDQGLVLKESDNAVIVGPRIDTFSPASALRCEVSDPGDINAVHNKSMESVDRFSSATGPDGGNLACVWAVRHIAKNALGRWITRTDGTAVFDPELRRCFGSSIRERDVPAGGIIISPTEGSNIGHVGILGPPTGDDSRLIYSNSSAAALWKQNFNLKKWVARYHDMKGLKVHFYPVPVYVDGGSA